MSKAYRNKPMSTATGGFSLKRATSLLLMLAFLVTGVFGTGFTAYAHTPEDEWRENGYWTRDVNTYENVTNETAITELPVLPEPFEFPELPVHPVHPILPETPEIPEHPILPEHPVLPQPFEEPLPPPIATGSLVITNLNQNHQPLPWTLFAVQSVFNEMPTIQLATGFQGTTQETELPVGEYFLVELVPSQGHEPMLDWIFFSITEGERTELTVFSNQLPGQPEPTPTPVPTPTPTPEPTPPPHVPEQTGRLLITKRAFGTNQPLPGAVFELRRPWDESLVATLVTDRFGEASIEVPAMDYFLREITAPQGFVLNTDRINVRVHADRVNEVTVTNTPIPAQPPEQTPEPPNIQQGRLLVTVRAARAQGAAQGQGALLPGAVFEVRNAMDNTLVAELVSDNFGEAAVNLVAGDFFLRQVVPPRGFVLNADRVSVRIAEGRITEINVTNEPVADETTQPTPTPTPTPTPGQGQQSEPGRLLVTLRAQGTGEPISGALFEVRGTFDDRLVAQLSTDQFGEAAANLAPGDFFLRQVVTPAGFTASSDRVTFTISAGELRNVAVTNAPVAAEDGDMQDMGPVAPGRLLVTILSGATGDRLPNAVVTIHDTMTDRLVAEMTTDTFGEASAFLPPGSYFMRQSALPIGYSLNMDRIPVTITSGAMTDFSIVARGIPRPTTATTPTSPPTTAPVSLLPPVTGTPAISGVAVTEITYAEPDDTLAGQGRLEIVTRAAQSGNPLSGGVFGVYRAADNRLVSELATGTDGTAYIELSPGGYFLQELRATFGFVLEPTRIFFEVAAYEVVVVEITKERDWGIADVDAEGMIWIPPTGEDMSVFHYLGGAFLIVVAAACGFLLLYTHKWKKPRSRYIKNFH